ncbi:spore coat protein [Sporolactobacillus sp. CPB3-1]|uniref:Spore coat protein n=1 Tax=Sporolactobacillus mangiferae TaxID=2940498 RepID=A0ABT0MBK9_9BACL|nr:CotD family spore coat protein [Sporolactobacillus mangiferae]MCL1632253.1 spore coat protein [Sporolactobacillus mangiferae]
MEVSPYSNSFNPVNPSNLGNAGHVAPAGNWNNPTAVSPSTAPKPEYSAGMKPVNKPAYKPAYKPSTAPAFSAKGKGAVPTPYGPSAGSGKAPSAGKSFENSINCPPAQGGTVYDPETVNVQHIFKPVIVQHIHRLHTIRKTHYIYEHQHFYPHTLSETCDERHYDVQCGKPCFPKPHC